MELFMFQLIPSSYHYIGSSSFLVHAPAHTVTQTLTHAHFMSSFILQLTLSLIPNSCHRSGFSSYLKSCHTHLLAHVITQTPAHIIIQILAYSQLIPSLIPTHGITHPQLVLSLRPRFISTHIISQTPAYDITGSNSYHYSESNSFSNS